MEITDRATALGREHRSWKLQNVELRASDTGDSLTFSGYAAVFDVPYEVNDAMGTYSETIRSGAFTQTLRQKADVRLLINHEGLPLARTSSGTMTLSEDSVGLRCEAELNPADPDVSSIRYKMARGDLNEMSHAFQAVRQEWNEDYSERSVIESKLFDVSVVTYPASPTTSAALRGAELRSWFEGLDTKALAELRESDPDLAKRIAYVLSNPDHTPGTGNPLAIAIRQLELLKVHAA